MPTQNTFLKDPREKLDYKFSFAPIASGDTDDPEIDDYLETGETISSYELISTALASSGCAVTLSGSSITDGGKSISFWVSGGFLYGDCNITCNLLTSMGREVTRTMKIELTPK